MRFRQKKTDRHYGCTTGFVLDWANTQEDFKPSDLPRPVINQTLRTMVQYGLLLKVARGSFGFAKGRKLVLREPVYRIAERRFER